MFFVNIDGEVHHRLRVVDHCGELHESYVMKRHDRAAVLKTFGQSI